MYLQFKLFFLFFFFFLKKESSGISSAGADKPGNRPPKPVIKELSVLSGADTDFRTGVVTVCLLLPTVVCPTSPKHLSSLEKLKLRSISEPLNVYSPLEKETPCISLVCPFVLEPDSNTIFR